MTPPSARGAAVAAVEVLLAAVLVAVAVWGWHRGMTPTEAAGTELFRVDGRWWAAAVLLATLAGLVLIDAARRIVLPTRTAATGSELVAPETDLTASRVRDHH